MRKIQLIVFFFNSHRGETKGASLREVACVTTWYLICKSTTLTTRTTCYYPFSQICVFAVELSVYQIISDVARSFKVVATTSKLIISRSTGRCCCQIDLSVSKMFPMRSRQVMGYMLPCFFLIKLLMIWFANNFSKSFYYYFLFLEYNFF